MQTNKEEGHDLGLGRTSYRDFNWHIANFSMLDTFVRVEKVRNTVKCIMYLVYYFKINQVPK